jgi:arylsulfatase A-like enzyme
LYRQVVGVPLVIVDPQRVPAGRLVVEPVSLRDIPATVVDLLGLASAAPFPGRSLARFWDGNEQAKASAREPLLMEAGKPLGLTNQGREPVAKGPMNSLIADGMHYIRTADGLEELYGLSSDPEERTNLAVYPFASEPLQRFRTRLSAMLKKRSPPTPSANRSVPLRRTISATMDYADINFSSSATDAMIND